MLGTARLLTFSFRAVILLLIIAMLWIGVAERYNEALVSVAKPILPAGTSASAVGSRHIVFENVGFASSVSIDGLTLHYGLILMMVLVLAAVGIGIIPRVCWLLGLGAGAFFVHALGVALLARGLVWASGAASPDRSGELIFSLFAVFWGLVPAAVGVVWCFLYWMPRVSGRRAEAPRGEQTPKAEASSSQDPP